MSIKQYGGVFGRNPTFNKITADSVETNLLTVDRLSTDGTLIAFEKDDTSVGSIGSQSGHVYISASGATSAGLRLQNNSIISPTKNAVVSDNTIDLGQVGARFKDAHLSGNLIIGTSGKGIDFSATAGTGTSELLDDYEEGTWTPELRFGGATPSGIVQTSSLGYYTKVGNLVTVQLKIILSSKGAQTGNAEIYGLPFSASAGGDAGAYSSYFNNLSLTASQVPIGKSSGSVMELRYPLNGVTVRMTHGNITDTTDIRMFSSYYI